MPATGGTGGGNTTEPRAYPIYRAAGSHRQLGRLHGGVNGEQIQAHLALLYETLGLSRDSFQKRVPVYRSSNGIACTWSRRSRDLVKGRE
ncbi:MAG: hypothetical protein R2849_14070 [Thermomicrobiales bacterium]